MLAISEKARKYAILGMAGAIVVIDSASYFMSMAADLLLVAILYAITQLPGENDEK
jgi:hypothetical protein